MVVSIDWGAQTTAQNARLPIPGAPITDPNTLGNTNVTSLISPYLGFRVTGAYGMPQRPGQANGVKPLNRRLTTSSGGR